MPKGSRRTNKQVKKQALSEDSSGRVHDKRQLPDNLIRFSFRHFITTDKFSLSGTETEYVSTLLCRLRDVSHCTVNDFRHNRSKALRAHPINWVATSEPNGFSHLNEQLQSCEPWQFSLSVNEHGRVHGLLIDDIFYVVWIDKGHQLYPGR